MGASSELLLAVQNVPPVLLAEEAQLVEPRYVEYEEFPADLPVTYDWMLQPASHRASRRVLGFLAVTVAALLIAVSVFLVHSLTKPSASVLASPPSSSP